METENRRENPEFDQKYASVLNSIEVLSLLVIFTFAGVIIRIELNESWGTSVNLLNFPPNTFIHFQMPTPMYFDILSNSLGCFIIGSAYTFNQRVWKDKKFVNIYIGITTGLAGSVTTFSGWQTQSLLFMIRKQVLSYFLIQFFGFAINYSSLMLGNNVSLFIIRFILKKPDSDPQPDEPAANDKLDSAPPPPLPDPPLKRRDVIFSLFCLLIAISLATIFFYPCEPLGWESLLYSSLMRSLRNLHSIQDAPI